MVHIVNEIQIDAPVEQAFDIVTTTSHWPRWHPATLEVGGVTDRPLRLGDLVRERAQLGARVYEGEWTVSEHIPLERLVLSMPGRPIEIRYAFERLGQATLFRRELDYQSEGYGGSAADAAALQQLMHEQSALGLRRLKELVEQQLAASSENA